MKILKNRTLSFAVLMVSFLLWTGVNAYAADKDNNPPGPAGGKGTNWENPPGAAGGPGTSPDKKHHGWAKAKKYGEKADTNHDGVIDETEKAQAKEVWAEKHKKKMDKADTNQDGVVDETEKAQAKEKWAEHHKKDKDNNPPGPKGGPGTNWEKNDFKHHDRDNNPPGPKGGKGTNWENPAGPKGGPGASPDRHK